MSSGLDLRKRGTRRDPDASKKQRLSPLSAIDAGSPGEVRVSTDAMMALQHLYNSSPSIQAARTVIIGQLLSSGCVVRRGGRDVELKDTFSRHLEDVWLPFARAVIDHFMMFGFVVVSLEEEVGGSSGGRGLHTPTPSYIPSQAPPPFANFVEGKKMAATSQMGPSRERDARAEPLTASETRARKPAPIDAHNSNSSSSSSSSQSANHSSANLIPHVPDIGQYEVSFVYVGESGYRRQYRIFTTSSDSIYRQDYASEIFFRTPPDIAGNICSPVATVFQSASFISALEELALSAEVVRARQMIVTQPVQRSGGNANLDPSNLFFDSESRAVQASAAGEDDANQASSLAIQAKMMQIINRLQTTDPNTGRERPNSTVSTGGVAGAVPLPIPPQLFAAPDRQQIVPGVRPPEARSDLVDLIRVVNGLS